jgi:hypothetical protein
VADSGTPLCTWSQFTEGAFADLARNYTNTQVQTDLLLEATRICEGIADRRLVSFTVTETHRAEGIDPDEYGDAANLPLDLQGTLGRSYAYALGASTLIRHCWLNEYAVRHPEYWAYGNVSVQLVRSYGGTQNLASTQTVGPEADSGHLWFNLGVFCPIGTLIRVTYTGGYQQIPADLIRACKLVTASLVLRELSPNSQSRNPELLTAEAMNLLKRYERC